MFRRLKRFLKLYLVSQPSLVYLFLGLRSLIASGPTDAQQAHLPFPGRTILFVDGSTPQCDRDAGALSIVQFMQVFVDHGWQVHLWPFDQVDRPHARSTLELRGIHVILSSRRAEGLRRWMSRQSGLYDVVFVSRPALAAYLLPWLRRFTRKTAYYGHDLHGERFLQEGLLTGQRELLLLSRRYSKLEKMICAVADCSYYPSAEEVSVIKKAVPQATIKELPPYSFDGLQQQPPPSPPVGAQLLFVGNFEHLPNLDAALWLLDELWPRIRASLGVAHLTIAGACPPTALIDRSQSYGGEVTLTGWITDQRLDELYRDSRLVIVPLRFGAGVKHKVVAAIMQGRPIVTTDIGLQGLPELQDVVGLAGNAHEFAQECEKLVGNDELWSARVHAARQVLSARFSRQAMWMALRDLYRDT